MEEKQDFAAKPTLKQNQTLKGKETFFFAFHGRNVAMKHFTCSSWCLKSEVSPVSNPFIVGRKPEHPQNDHLNKDL